MDNATISRETGLNQKQVSNALLKLKKEGKIKSVKRGVHTAIELVVITELRLGHPFSPTGCGV